MPEVVLVTMLACCRFTFRPTAKCGLRLFGAECVRASLRQNFKLRSSTSMRGKVLSKSLMYDREGLKSQPASPDSADECAILDDRWRQRVRGF